MSYRPYPDADRALRQIGRHYSSVPLSELPEAWRQFGASFGRLHWQTRRALEARRNLSLLGPDDDATGLIQAAGDATGFVMFPPGEYRLSTRPRIVGGHS